MIKFIMIFYQRVWEFHQIYTFGAVGDKDELIRFLGEKAKGQGHSQILWRRHTAGPFRCKHWTA